MKNAGQNNTNGRKKHTMAEKTTVREIASLHHSKFVRGKNANAREKIVSVCGERIHYLINFKK